MAGLRVRRINDEGEELFSGKEVFPEGSPQLIKTTGAHGTTRAAKPGQLVISVAYQVYLCVKLVSPVCLLHK